MNGDRPRRQTQQTQRFNGNTWKVPLTVSALIALVTALGYLVNAVWAVESRTTHHVDQRIGNHNVSSQSHPDIRSTVKEMRGLRSDIKRTRHERRELMRLLREKAK